MTTRRVIELTDADFAPIVFFGSILTTYREMAGLNMTQLSNLLETGWSIGYISQLERGLVSPPKGKRPAGKAKLAKLAAVLAETIHQKKSSPEGNADLFAERILSELQEAAQKHRQPDTHSQRVAFRLLALIMTGDEDNWLSILQLAKASDSRGALWEKAAAVYPEFVTVKRK